MNVVSLPIFQRIIYEDWDELLNTVEFGLLTTTSCRGRNADWRSRLVVTAILTAVQEGDDRCLVVDAHWLGISRAGPEDYCTGYGYSDRHLSGHDRRQSRSLIGAFLGHQCQVPAQVSRICFQFWRTECYSWTARRLVTN